MIFSSFKFGEIKQSASHWTCLDRGNQLVNFKVQVKGAGDWMCLQSLRQGVSATQFNETPPMGDTHAINYWHTETLITLISQHVIQSTGKKQSCAVVVSLCDQFILQDKHLFGCYASLFPLFLLRCLKTLN